MAERPRDNTIDILRGFAIILVILGHITLTPKLLEAWIYTFHMPLFFVCSGLVFSVERYPGYGAFVRSRLKSIVLPYVSLGILLWILVKIWEAFLARYYGMPELSVWDPGYLLAALCLNFRLHNYYYEMWFLCTLFVAQLLFYFIAKAARGRRYLLPLTAVAGVALEALITRRVKGAVWSVDLVPVGMAFLSLGYWLRQAGPKLKKHARIWQLPLALAANLGFGALNYHLSGGRVDLYTDVMGNPALFLLSACAGCWAAYVAANWMGSMKITEFFGRNSLIVYVFQGKLTIPIAVETGKWLSWRSELAADTSFQWVYVTAVSLLLSAALAWALPKYCPWLLGKAKKHRL